MRRTTRDHFELHRDGDKWRWINRPLDIDDSFVFGDVHTLPYEPFEYITRQAQGDFTLQDQRNDNLYVDGGMVTTQADWSLEFNVGMTFHEWHGPVPLAHDLGVFDPRTQISDAHPAGPARPPAQLDDDSQSPTGYLAPKTTRSGGRTG